MLLFNYHLLKDNFEVFLRLGDGGGAHSGTDSVLVFFPCLELPVVLKDVGGCVLL